LHKNKWVYCLPFFLLPRPYLVILMQVIDIQRSL
jgi:hypothetical protein